MISRAVEQLPNHPRPTHFNIQHFPWNSKTWETVIPECLSFPSDTSDASSLYSPVDHLAWAWRSLGATNPGVMLAPNCSLCLPDVLLCHLCHRRRWWEWADVGFVCIVITRTWNICGASLVIIYILHLGQEIPVMLQIEFSFYVMVVLYNGDFMNGGFM